VEVKVGDSVLHSFLSHVGMPMQAEQDIMMANLSVRPFDALWYCIETNACITKLFPPSCRGTTLNFFERYCHYKILRGTPSAEALKTHGWKNL